MSQGGGLNMEREKSTVLVVDDAPENIDVLRGILKADYKVKVAINGERALEVCNSDNPPDLVLLDIMMPGMDGYEVCRRLKADPATEGVPVIFVTAKNETYDEVAGFEVGGVDFISKPVTPAVVLARVATHLQLRQAYRFIRDTFGRYLSEEIVDTLVSTPHGLKLGGERRKVTILMADIRGFTPLCEGLQAESVVEILNTHLGVMTDVIAEHQGTIDEFIGDAILVMFGAPVQRQDDSLRAVRCAIAMQQAMQTVNARFREKGYPEVAMGIGLHTGEVIVGNIGSQKRSKYGVVGRVINTASRIESYTLGGQILISDSTLSDCGTKLRIDGSMQAMLKGISHEMTIYQIGGIDGERASQLPQVEPEQLADLGAPLDVQLRLMAGKHVTNSFPGRILRAGKYTIHIQAEQDCANYSNLHICSAEDAEPDSEAGFYAKVTSQVDGQLKVFEAHATSVSGDIHGWVQQQFQAQLAGAGV